MDWFLLDRVSGITGQSRGQTSIHKKKGSGYKKTLSVRLTAVPHALILSLNRQKYK